MTRLGGDTATAAFVPAARLTPPAFDTVEIAVPAPPQPPRPGGGAAGLVPVALALAMVALMGVGYRSGAAAAHHPVFLGFPLLMLASTTATAISSRRRRPGGDLDADRDQYLDQLSDLRAALAGHAAAQLAALHWQHPDPDLLWSLVGGPRMWERRPADPDFGRIRVGVGAAPAAARPVAPPVGRGADPVTATALRRLLAAYTTLADAPIAVDLLAAGTVVVDGEPDAARAWLRSALCQLAVLHGPDVLLIAAVAGEHQRTHWDWLKWLPQHSHPLCADQAGPVRLSYPNVAAARAALTGVAADRRTVLIVDGAERTGGASGWTIIQVGGMSDGAGVRVRVGDDPGYRPDAITVTDALVCARRLAGYRLDTSIGPAGPASWADLLGLDDPARLDPRRRWAALTPGDRLRVPIGVTAAGEAVWLDLREAAEGGSGPHGLCIGATGSGKSELLRTLVLGLMVRHPPDALNLVLVDFKGGATFLDMEPARHVAALITNLADEAPLVARMRDALAGELNRRQELLRAAGNFVSAAAYQQARRAGAPLAPLPALLVVVDEFSELLAQHPDFVDTFVAVGRLGRSLGVHLLLASQRLDEGRLRGMEAHLSYRICLKTLSASESRAVLGVPDAHQLPNTPGRGLLRLPSGELVGFQTAFVSGPCRPGAAEPVGQRPGVRRFTAAPVGPISTPGAAAGGSGASVLRTVLGRLAGHGAPAHRVWLAPLADSPTLDGLLGGEPRQRRLSVPIGIVDRPFQQRRTPLIVELAGAAGNVAVVGAPQSGKSTALATLVTALAATHQPSDVALYCLDFGGGALSSVRSLPQVGAVAGRGEPELVRRMVAELASILARREAAFVEHGIDSMQRYRQLRAESRHTDRFGDVFLVIDGWSAFCRDFDALEGAVVALAGRGLSFGVHLVLSATRWADIRSALRDQLGTRIELRLGDPADSEVDRRAAQRVPRDRPGRGLTEDGLHTLIALPRLGGRPVCGGRKAPPIPLLPARVELAALARSAGQLPVLGVEESQLDTVALDFTAQPHLLVFGDGECGKTAALRTVCRELARTATPDTARLLVVDYRRGLLGVVDPEQLAGYAMSPAALSSLLIELRDRLAARMPGPQLDAEQLRERSWWSGPELFLLVDDYDLVAPAAGAAANPLAFLLEYLPHAADLGLHLVIARRSGGAGRALYEPLLAALRDLGAMGLVMSGDPDESALVGAARPAPRPPGRAVLVTRRGGERLVQVAWSAPP